MADRRTSRIDIKGINLIDSGIHVADGFCEKIHNLRVTGSGQWSNVCELNKIAVIDPDGTVSATVIFKHDVLPDSDYITLSDNKVYVSALDDDGLFTHKQQLLSSIPTNIKVTAHGNILSISGLNYNQIFDYHFLYDPDSGKYQKIDFANLKAPIIKTVTVNKIEAPTQSDISSVTTIRSTLISRIKKNYVDGTTTEKEDLYNTYLNDTTYVKGCFLIFVAYKLQDGSIIKMSSIERVGYETNNYYKREEYLTLSHEVTYKYFQNLYAYSPTLTFSIDTNVKDNLFIKSVVVYATRPEQNFIYGNLDGINDDIVRTIEKDTDMENGYTLSVYECNAEKIRHEPVETLAELPFYEIAELALDETSITLTKKHFETIESEPVYEANYSAHATYSFNKFYYNNRLHAFDIRQVFSAGTQLMPYAYDGAPDGLTRNEMPNEQFILRTYIEAEGKTFIVQKSQIAYTFGDDQRIYLPRFVSYPDSRATKIEIIITTGSGAGWLHVATINLKSSDENNVAYRNVSVEYLTLFDTDPIEITGYNDKNILDNKIYVSKADNPFYFEPDKVISVDANIMALHVGLEQLSESRFGDYPLHIFTDNGIYVAESGSGEVLYARIVPLNKDVIIDGTPIITADRSIVYITSRGVMALNGTKSSCISTYMHDPLSNFLDYVRTLTVMFYLASYDELVLFNNTHTYAYVFSGKYNVWFTRDIDVIRIISPRLFANSTGIYDYIDRESNDTYKRSEILTRPIKLGNYETKRIDILIARLQARNFVLRLEGTNDLVLWETLRVSDRARIRRSLQSYRYFRIGLSSDAALTVISGFDIELYNRFVRHLE